MAVPDGKARTWKAAKPVIGLVGGIGSGKSLVADLMAQEGCAVINADHLAHEVINQADARKQLVAWWGPTVLAADGTVDRRAVGSIVFHNPEQLRKLEGLIHPRILARRQELHRQYQADPRIKAIVEDAPLLLEKGLDAWCDVIVLVQARWETRLARVQRNRNWTEEDLRSRENQQWPLDSKAKRADYVVENDAGEAECSSQVRQVLSLIFHDRG